MIDNNLVYSLRTFKFFRKFTYRSVTLLPKTYIVFSFWENKVVTICSTNKGKFKYFTSKNRKCTRTFVAEDAYGIFGLCLSLGPLKNYKLINRE